MGAAVVRGAEAEEVAVAGGEDGHRTVRPRVLDAVGKRVVAEQTGQEGDVAPEAQVDNLGAMVDDPMDAGIDVVDRPAAAAVEDLGHDELGAGSDTGDADPVVGRRCRPAHVGAVAVVVHRRRVLTAPDAVGEAHDLARQILMTGVDTSVDDADPNAGARGPGPRRGRADLMHVPLGARQISGRAGPPGRAHGDGCCGEECERHCA